jgi:voltage-gated potassium channel
MVLAVRNPEPALMNPYRSEGVQTLVANPGGHVRLGPGQLLVVMGSKDQLARFSVLLGPALMTVDVMTS